MAELSVKEFNAKLQTKINGLKKENLPFRNAVQTVHALRINRIFHKGLKGKSYNSTTELWASDKNLRRAGTHKGKTGKATKTSYYKSYKALKAQQGFDPNKVNLRMTNNLQSAFANANLSPNNDSIPKDTIPDKISPFKYVERADNQDKLRGLEKKYGAFFNFTSSERRKFRKTFEFEMNKYLSA